MTNPLGAAIGAGAPAGSRLDAVERFAWGIQMPTRRFFVTLAAGLAVVLATAGLASAAVMARNADTIASAEESGLGMAKAAAEYRTELAAADAQAAATLISGGLEDPERRAAYDESILRASTALTQAALVGQDEDVVDIEALSDGLLDFTGSVATSRANSRQGFPVGAAYLSQARTLARTDLAPRADRLRRSGERRVAEAANTVGGPRSTAAVGVLLLAAAALVGGSALVAGRTRRIVHPALALAVLAAFLAVVLVIAGVGTQSAELREAASQDLGRFVAANEAASNLSNLRVTEINAVAARGSGDALFAQFQDDAIALQTSLAESPSVSPGLAGELQEAVQEYIDGVYQVAQADEAGDNQGAAELTLSGPSSEGYARASLAAASSVETATDVVTDRVADADDGSVDPVVPLTLMGLAAVCAAAGVLRRARRYR